MKFSDRTNWPKGHNRLSDKLQAVRSTGAPYLDLTVSNPTQCGFRYLSTDLLDALLNPRNLMYEPEAHGLLPARQAIADYYAAKGIDLALDQIFITANTSEAYSFIFRLLVNREQAVVAPQPSYPLLDYLTGLNDTILLRYPLAYNGLWSLDTLGIAEQLSFKTPALILVHPNNPTGSYIQAAEREALRKLCRGRGTAFVVDEVFFDYFLGSGETPQSFAGENEILTFTLSGISKVLGLPQMKLSWIVVSGPEAERKEAIRRLEIISDTYLSAGAPPQNALAEWLKDENPISQEILHRVRQNYETAKTRLPILNIQGGWYILLEMPADKTDEEWCLFLLEKENLLVHPGYLFDFLEDQFVVLSLLPEEEKFKEGVRRLAKYFV